MERGSWSVKRVIHDSFVMAPSKLIEHAHAGRATHIFHDAFVVRPIEAGNSPQRGATRGTLCWRTTRPETVRREFLTLLRFTPPPTAKNRPARFGSLSRRR